MATSLDNRTERLEQEIARLRDEVRQRSDDLQEALEYQVAISEVLKVISGSTFDLEAVLQTIVSTAYRLCRADHGSIFRNDGGAYRWAAGHALSAEYEERERAAVIRPGTGTLIGRTVLDGRTVQIEDAWNDPLYEPKEDARIGGVRAMLGVPLLREGRPLGAIGLARNRVEPFTAGEAQLVATFADQAVIAMENARLLGELRARTDEIAGWNQKLEARVAAQVEELGRVGRLKQFLAPQLAELVVSRGDEAILESHRREIVVVFCDLRGYTSFSETAEPEEVIEVLREYHTALGPLVAQFEGTLDQFSGDGIMVFFNDPVPCPDPAERAVRMAMAMREAAAALMAAWRRRGHQLGFGVGVAQGYATLGQIGFAERVTYTAIGTVCNLAARLCAEAQPGQILISQRVAAAVEDAVTLEEIGNLALKGLSQAVAVYNVVRAG